MTENLIEIDMYSVIKQKYIERDVLDKIRAEIKDNRDDWIKGQDPEWHTYDRCLQIIDKYISGKENK